jgi:hypothetical protein
MNFKKNKYIIVKNAVPKDISIFAYNYFLLKRRVARTLIDVKYISPFETAFGSFGDGQIPNSYSHYSDIVMETILLMSQPVLEKNTKLKLSPTYSYARIYQKGDILHKHKDRFSCEISATLNLGGDPWPIFIEPDSKIGVYVNDIYQSGTTKGLKVNLSPGDMLIYSGNILEHWREKFEGDECAQVFLHYNNIKTEETSNNFFDGRPHIGLPNWFKKQ